MEGFYVDPTLPVTKHHSVYSAIDPQSIWDRKSYTGKVILITGASRGIGRQLALYYAKAGARLALVARSSLDETEAVVRSDAPDTSMLKFAGDVTDTTRAREIVQETVKQFGRLDIVIPNAGTANVEGKRIGEIDPAAWWASFEVNLKGVFNYVNPALAYLEQVAGHIVIISSSTMNARAKTTSDYMISKHAVSRLVEFIALEYPTVPTFSLHPGSVATELSLSNTKIKPEYLADSPELGAAAALQLTSGRFDWLSGRYVDATWDLGEIERDWKGKILEKGRFGALVSKFALI